LPLPEAPTTATNDFPLISSTSFAVNASLDPRLGAPLLGTFAEDLTGKSFGVPGFEVRWLVFQVTGNRFGIIVHATSTSDLSQRWTNVLDPDTGMLTGWVPAL
jgi:hypothetical protein